MSKSEILQRIRRNKPEPCALPEIPDFPVDRSELLGAFRQMAQGMGSGVLMVTGESEIPAAIAERLASAPVVVSTLPGIPTSIALDQVSHPLDLQSVEVAVLRGQFGVAENAAIWLTEAECVHRILPFIAEHLVLVIDAASIVANMHEAYSQIQIDDTGFGVFVAGPSKTADIEQSLVIGAQGARSLTVVLVTGS
jgi:L-lactate dehydrogenase complex protein LldG